MKELKLFFGLMICAVCIGVCCSCSDDDDNGTVIPPLPEVDIADDIPGEWVYDHPEEGAWQSMKFVQEGAFFCFSDNKSNWTKTLERIEQGNYGVEGKKVSAQNGTTYLDMTVSEINGYQFMARLNESTLDLTYHKVVMRTHLSFGESVIPPYSELVDTTIIGYKSHDESLALVESSTGEITATANNGRTYVDIITANGTAVIKVMIGKINDGDEDEVSPIKGKVFTPIDKNINLPVAILGKWVWDKNYWELFNFLGNGKVYYSNEDKARKIYNDNASGDYTIDTENNTLTLHVLPTGGTPMTVIMSITAINRYCFTAKFFLENGQSTGTYTYSKLLDTLELTVDSTVAPDYHVDDETIISGFKSHNTKIVDVDSVTGELKGKKTGRTYVDVITDEGTAVVEVNVK